MYINDLDWSIIPISMADPYKKEPQRIITKNSAMDELNSIKKYVGLGLLVEQSNIWVLEIDDPINREYNGFFYLDEWSKENKIDLNKCIHSKSTTGKISYFFKADDRIKKNINISLPAINNLPSGEYSIRVKSKDIINGYIENIIMPPFYDLNNGAVYDWIVSPENVEISKAPEKLIELIIHNFGNLIDNEQEEENENILDEVEEDPNFIYEKIHFAVLTCWSIQRTNDQGVTSYLTEKDLIKLGIRLKMLENIMKDKRYYNIFDEFYNKVCSFEILKIKNNPNERKRKWNNFKFDQISKPCSDIFYWAEKGNPTAWYQRYPKKNNIIEYPFKLTNEISNLMFGAEADVAQAVSIVMEPYLRFSNKRIIFYSIEDKLWHVSKNGNSFLIYLKNICCSILDKIKSHLSQKKRTVKEQEKYNKIYAIVAKCKTRNFLNKILPFLEGMLLDKPELRNKEGNIIKETNIKFTEESEKDILTLIDVIAEDKKQGKRTVFNEILNDIIPMTLLQRLNCHPGTEHLVPFSGGRVYNLISGTTEERKQYHFFRWEMPGDINKSTKEGIKAMGTLWYDIFSENKIYTEYMWLKCGSFLTGESPNGSYENWIGESGSNGKSIILSILSRVMGPFYHSTSSETILKSSGPKDGNKPRPDRLIFMGKRFVACPEIPEESELDAEFVKKLSGPDEISVRDLYGGADEIISFKPVCKFAIVSNFPAKFNANDGGVLRRVHYRKFTQKFVDNPIEPNEKKKDIYLDKKNKYT